MPTGRYRRHVSYFWLEAACHAPSICRKPKAAPFADDRWAMPVARLARFSDLPSLLALFEVSEVSGVAQPRERAENIWRETLMQPGVNVFVSDDRHRVAATCMLVTAPNLLRGGRRHGFLENVLTHPELRGLGHGKAVVRAALIHAWAADCHHVLMQSGRADPRVHSFYEGLGFRPGLRVAYVATRPPTPSE